MITCGADFTLPDRFVERESIAPSISCLAWLVSEKKSTIRFFTGFKGEFKTLMAFATNLFFASFAIFCESSPDEDRNQERYHVVIRQPWGGLFRDRCKFG